MTHLCRQNGTDPNRNCPECMAGIESPDGLWHRYLRTCKGSAPWVKVGANYFDDVLNWTD